MDSSLNKKERAKRMLREFEGARGVAVLEALAVLPVFFILWAGLFGVHAAYAAKAEAVAAAHAEGIAAATSGRCGSGKKGATTSASGQELEEALASASGDGSVADLMREAGGDHLFDWSPMTVTSVVAFGDASSGASASGEAKGAARHLCNTRPLKSLTDAFWNMVKGWVD